MEASLRLIQKKRTVLLQKAYELKNFFSAKERPEIFEAVICSLKENMGTVLDYWFTSENMENVICSDGRSLRLSYD